MLTLLIGLGALAPQPAWAGYAAIVIDYNSGRVLHEENPDAQNYPASLTKMMTLYMLFDSLRSGRVNFGSRIPISAHAARQAPSKLGINPGGTISVDDAIRALVTKSANDVAVGVGEFIGGNEPAFAQMMTRKAQQLGMTHTTFRNACGLPNLQQVTTARDMATLGIALRRDFPQYYHYFSVRSFEYNGQVIPTHNRVLLNYQGADGIKTGFIAASGFNLVSSARRNGVTLVGVVLGGRTGAWRDRRMMELLDDGFDSAAQIQKGYAPKGTAPMRPVVIEPPAAATIVSPPVALAGRGRAKDEPVKPVVTSPAATLALTAPAKADKNAKNSKTEKNDKNDKNDKKAAPADDNKDTGGMAFLMPAGAHNTWGVQVGAYSSFANARQQAEQVALALRSRVGTAHAAVTPAKSGDGLIYRARVMGLDSEAEARTACGQLRASKLTCIMVSPSSDGGGKPAASTSKRR